LDTLQVGFPNSSSIRKDMINRSICGRTMSKNSHSNTGLDHATISFPGSAHQGEVYLEPMARSLVIPQTRKALADILRPLLNSARFLGLPAVFGIRDAHSILADIEKLVGVPIFEIPTMPPSIPGLRIKETFESNLPAKNVRRFFQKRVMGVQMEEKGFVVQIGDTSPETIIKTKEIVLASWFLLLFNIQYVTPLLRPCNA
jgi:glycerol-3-phosphate dehydrogenase subunit B